MSKYKAKRVQIDGLWFDSIGEANRHQELLMLERAGEISHLERQPRFILQASFTDNQGRFQRAIWYKADWSYIEGDNYIVEDFKGFETPVFKLKAKMFQFQYRRFVLRITTR